MCSYSSRWSKASRNRHRSGSLPPEIDLLRCILGSTKGIRDVACLSALDRRRRPRRIITPVQIPVGAQDGQGTIFCQEILTAQGPAPSQLVFLQGPWHYSEFDFC